jgi:hypothetical protein
MKRLNRELLFGSLLLCAGIAEATPVLDQQNAPEGNDVLAIVLNSQAPNMSPADGRYDWELGGSYFRGTAFTKLDSKFQPFPETDDFHFKTFVEPVTAPAPLSLIVGGLLGLIALRRRMVAIRKRSVEVTSI